MTARSDPLRSGGAVRLVLVGVLLLCALAAGALTLVVLKHQREIGRTFGYDITWDAEQTLAATLRVELAVTLLDMPASNADPDEARLRFDVLLSALQTLLQDDKRALVEAHPAEVDATLDGITAAITAARPLLDDVEQLAARQRILGLLRPFNGRLSLLVAMTNSEEARAIVAGQRQLTNDHWKLSGMLGALVVYGLAVVAMLSRRNSLLSRAHGDVRNLADSLQLAGDELVAASHAVQSANAELSLQNGHFHAALDNMSQALCMVDTAQKLIVCNRRFIDLFALDPASATPGMPMHDLASDRQGDPADRRVIRALLGEHALLTRQQRAAAFIDERPDGRALAVSHQPLPDGGWVATYEDVTERRRVEARIAHMAHHDSLTGLPNRARYRKRIEEIVEQTSGGNGHLSVLLLDLDHFKEVNDTLGHGAGDALLEAVAGRLRACTRDADLVARLGGDEFAVIQAPGVQPVDAAELAQRIVETIGAPYEIEGERVLVSASVGIAVEPVHGASAEVLLKYADMALYQAKANGRNTYCFYVPSMDQQLQTRRALSADLRDAITLGQFEVHYQPVIDLHEGRIGGFEALIRWFHPDRGLVSPVQFIPLAEETGLITAIGEWILRQACVEAASWPPHVKVAVNLSPRQFRGSDVLRMVTRALQHSGLEPGRLELEITESLLLQDGDDVLGVLRDLRGLGVGVALDDFGTGYSSLSYLRKFPFSKLKIDQSFVRGLSEREDCIIIIQAVTAMARRLGMIVTAEGIETDEQLAVIKEAGCNQGQGYLFSRPVRADAAARLMVDFGRRDAELQAVL